MPIRAIYYVYVETTHKEHHAMKYFQVLAQVSNVLKGLTYGEGMDKQIGLYQAKMNALVAMLPESEHFIVGTEYRLSESTDQCLVFVTEYSVTKSIMNTEAIRVEVRASLASPQGFEVDVIPRLPFRVESGVCDIVNQVFQQIMMKDML